MIKDDEGWRMMISSCLWVLLMDRQTNKQTDICDCRVAFATENHFYKTPSWFLGSGSWEVKYKDKDSVGVEEGVDDPDKGDGGWSRSNSWWSCKQTGGGQTFELFGLWKSSIIGCK